jgi:hypothetical protein
MAELHAKREAKAVAREDERVTLMREFHQRREAMAAVRGSNIETSREHRLAVEGRAERLAQLRGGHGLRGNAGR